MIQAKRKNAQKGIKLAQKKKINQINCLKHKKQKKKTWKMCSERLQKAQPFAFASSERQQTKD